MSLGAVPLTLSGRVNFHRDTFRFLCCYHVYGYDQIVTKILNVNLILFICYYRVYFFIYLLLSYLFYHIFHYHVYIEQKFHNH